jgi:hypothetical protein
MRKIGLKFTALYKSNFSTFEQVNQLKSIFLTVYKDKLVHDANLEWLTLYNDNPEKHFKEYGFISLTGLNGIKFNISPTLVELVTEWEWLFFLRDLDNRKELREMCLRIAKHLSNPIYVPDSYCYSSYVFEGKTYKDVIVSLQEQYGEPVKDISKLLVQQEMYWDTVGYYIDSHS